MKNERVLKVTEKYNEKWMFLMKGYDPHEIGRCINS
jgi:hypothetical protein